MSRSLIPCPWGDRPAPLRKADDGGDPGPSADRVRRGEAPPVASGVQVVAGKADEGVSPGSAVD